MATVPKSSQAQRDNSFDCFPNRHEITVLLSYIHAHNHKSTEDDNVSIPCHYKIEAQHCFERNTAFDRNDALLIVLGHGAVRMNSQLFHSAGYF
jgi:hypothetical protein